MTYFPIGSIPEILGQGPALVAVSGIGAYSSGSAFASGFLMDGVLGMILGALLILMATYVAIPVYHYACKLVAVLVKFLPRLAIPIALRKRDIPEDQRFQETSLP